MKLRFAMLLAVTCLLAPLATGCSPFAPFYLGALMLGYDTRVPPTFEFPDDAKRLAIITYANLDTQVEFGRLDLELNEAVALRLFNAFDADKKPIQVIKASKIAQWQDEHPDWTTWEKSEIGRALRADYVIFLEVEKLSLYEDGPSKQLYHGLAEIGLSVVRVASGTEAFAKDVVSVEVPRGRPIPADQIPVAKFRREFINRIADRISWYFLPHDRNLEYDRDPI